MIRILDDPTGHFVYDLEIKLHLEEASHANIVIFLWYLLHCKASYCKIVIVEGSKKHFSVVEKCFFHS